MCDYNDYDRSEADSRCGCEGAAMAGAMDAYAEYDHAAMTANSQMQGGCQHRCGCRRECGCGCGSASNGSSNGCGCGSTSNGGSCGCGCGSTSNGNSNGCGCGCGSTSNGNSNGCGCRCGCNHCQRCCHNCRCSRSRCCLF